MRNPSRRGNLLLTCLGLAVAGLLSTRTAQAQSVIAWGDNTKGQTNVPPEAAGAVAVAAGYYHNLALRGDGTVVAWGDSTYGQTKVPATATNVVAISAAGFHSLALRADGTVVAWGQTNFWYAPGNYNLNAVPASASNVVAIAAGDYHNLALRRDGMVVGWGDSPESTPPASLNKVVRIWAGAFCSVAQQENGCVVLWSGAGGASMVSGGGTLARTLTNIVTLAPAYRQNLALLPDGSVARWGDYTRMPPYYYTNNYVAIPASATDVVAIAASTESDPNAPRGPYCDFALRRDGKLIAWGNGAGTNVPPSATNLIAVAAGFKHGVAIQGDGSPRILGSPTSRRQVSAGDTLPVYVRAVSSAPLSYQWLTNGSPVTFAGGPLFTAAPSLDNTNLSFQVVVSNALGSATSAVSQVSVRALNVWGDNRNWQRVIPDDVVAPVAVAAGGYHCLALNQNGTVCGWGKNLDGQTTVPVSATNVVALAAGGDHSLALRNDGTVVGWGRDWDGQVSVPPAATNVVAISAGLAFSLALRADGTVVAWGNDEVGQTEVPLLTTPVKAISAGYYHSVALLTDGTVVCWGSDVETPTNATDVVAISAGWEHCLALRSDGTVIAWGDDSYHQTDVPASATNVVAIAAGYYHDLALRADGTVIAWGTGYLGTTNVPSALSRVDGIAVTHDCSLGLAVVGAPRFGPQLASAISTSQGETVLTMTVVGAGPLSFQWYHDGTAIAGATAVTLVLTNTSMADAGSYVLVASNPAGQSSSQAVQLTVLRAPLRFANTGLALGATNGFSGRLTGASGAGPIVIYASTNLGDWTPILTNPPAVGALEFLDPDALQSEQRFYRAVEMAPAAPPRLDSP